MSTKLELGILESLHEVHEKILKEHTGGLCKFAGELYLHPSTLKRRLDMLRTLGGDIQYDKIRRTYFYDNVFEFEFHVSVHPKNDTEPTAIQHEDGLK